MRRYVVVVALCAVALLWIPSAGHGQTWPDMGSEESGVTWIIGGYAPMGGLGSFADYRMIMDPWLVLGISLQAGEDEDRLRSRFEVTAVPNVAMRRNPPRSPAARCEECTADDFRLTVVNSRFLMDVTFPFPGDSRAYVTAGPAVRFQLSNPDQCPTSAGRECALPQFARSRLDPGLVAGAGWEPSGTLIQAIQLTGRASLYGRGARPDASPVRWLPELDLVVRISP